MYFPNESDIAVKEKPPSSSHIERWNPKPSFSYSWAGSTLSKECSLHQLSPYIGKMKSSMARDLVDSLTSPGDYIYDPFCGSGTIALEAWISNRNIIANDLNPYAYTLTKAKLAPPGSISEIKQELNRYSLEVHKNIQNIDLRKVPKWVRSFYHPKTLKEIISWFNVLDSKNQPFIQACLLGILHHQRPGFLSYPSSHTAPYLRIKKFPIEEYPEMYQYRSVEDRLEKKVMRALKRVPSLDPNIERDCCMKDASCFIPSRKIDAIITSPPYMKQLDYARDNRLRLWFLGLSDWKKLDTVISPSRASFIESFSKCLELWQHNIKKDGTCTFVVGDNYCKEYDLTLPDMIIQMAETEIGGYSLVYRYSETIPDERRVRRNCRGNLAESILTFKVGDV